MLGLPDRILMMIFGGVATMLAVALALVTLDKNSQIHSLEQAIEKPVTGYRARLEAAQAANTTLRNNQAALTQSVAAQNASVDSNVAAAATKYQLGAVERQRAAKQAEQSYSLEARIARMQRGANMAASADALILESVK